MRGHRIARAPNNAQATYLARAAGTGPPARRRFAYNWALAEWQRQYREHLEDESLPKPSQQALRRQLNALKREKFPWMLEVTKNAPQMAIVHLGDAFRNFFAKRARYPRLRRKGVHDRFTLSNEVEKQVVCSSCDGCCPVSAKVVDGNRPRYLHPADAEAYGLRHGDWAWVETTRARVAVRADVRDQMPKGLVRVPHGWWKPESARGLERLSGMWTFSDAQLSDDDDMSLMDLEQGIPHLQGVPCRVTKLTADELADLEARYGKSSELPPGPAARVHARTEARDFMYDPEIGDGVEWEAIELALYGKGSPN